MMHFRPQASRRESGQDQKGPDKDLKEPQMRYVLWVKFFSLGFGEESLSVDVVIALGYL